MISLMPAFSRIFPVLPVKGFYKAFIILSLSLFSLVEAQNEDELTPSVPSEETSVPSEETSVPSEETSVPSEEASAPSEETSVSSEETSVSSEETSVSSEETSVSSEETSVSSEETSVPSEETSAPSEETSARSEEALDPSISSSKNSLNSSNSDYTNFAQKGSYENEAWFAEVPEWHYYDMFGNKLIDGYYLYGLSLNRNTIGRGTNNIALHPFLKKWMNGLVQVTDLHENGGIMAMMGDRIKSEFTPFSFKQTLFTGARVDVFYKKNSLTFLTNRISDGGFYGMFLHRNNPASTAIDADWLTGVHGGKQFGEVVDVNGTFVNLHHEVSREKGNPFSGVDSDTSAKKTPNGLSLYGLDVNLKLARLQAYGEYLRSQEYFDGNFKPKAGNVATLNGRYDIFDRWRCGGEFYTIGSRFQTNFTCPAHPYGDASVVGRYQYSLIEDNDDEDQYPENGKTRYSYFTQNPDIQGDLDGIIPVNYDKDKNGVWDYKEDFLSHDADPPESKILFDRNNNGFPDEIEDDAYPDYPYVPSYYLPDERYWRYDDIDKKWENKLADSLTLTQKGLAGLHLYTRFEILQGLELTVGGIYDKSQEKTFQPTYVKGVETGETYGFENAISLYFLTHYKKDIARDKYFMVDNLFRKVKDNIPNHTQGFLLDNGSATISYYIIADELDYRDMFADALRAEFTIFRNRGLNFTTAGKYEFQKHFPHLEFNYPEATISSLMLINKIHYIFRIPVLKDMFIIPKYKNIWDVKDYGPRADSVDTTFDATFNASRDAKYRRNAMINAGYLVFDWKFTEKTVLSTGVQLQQFNDFLDIGENYLHRCFTVQLRIKDRYRSTTLVLTTGISLYSYIYELSGKGRTHNKFNNPHGVERNYNGHEIFIRVHCGYL